MGFRDLRDPGSSDYRQTNAAKVRLAWGDCEEGMGFPSSRSILQKWELFRKFPFLLLKLSTLCRQLELPGSCGSRKLFLYSMEQSNTGFVMISFVKGASVTAARAKTIFPAGTECVSHTLPPMMQSFPIRVSPPRIVAPE